VEAPRLTRLRDGALLVEHPGLPDDEANHASVRLGRELREARLEGLLDAIPGARSLLLLFEPEKLSLQGRAEEIARAAGREEPEGEIRLHRIPVVYDGEDLATVGKRSGLGPEEFARRHAGAAYRVAFVGFAPGFAYLSGLPPELAASRLPSPRARVPRGSVAIGGPWTGIYPSESPGGWNLIGRTSVHLFDPRANPPSRLRAGDRVAFEAARPDELPPPPAEPAAFEPAGRPLLRVVSPGLFTSAQGAPRYGLGSFGVPAGGAMDLLSLDLANTLVGNGPGTAALEMTLAGPELECLEDAVLAVAGAPLDVSVEGRPAPFGRSFRARRGERVRCGRTSGGARAYLAVRGGLERGLPGEATKRIAREEVLAAGVSPVTAEHTRASAVPLPSELRLRVVLGPEVDRFPPNEIDRFLHTVWRVSPESDRRGLRLDGRPLEFSAAAEISPAGMPPGTIEVPAGGLPILLGPDGPVTGGYPRIAAVIGADLRLLGQARPGDALRFQAVSLHEALLARSRMSLP
jgi:KipI family sensor histidine kinase inhibitor